MAKFSAMIEYLEQGYPIYRSADPEGSFTFRQVPAVIAVDVIPKMTSVPDKVKSLMAENGNPFSYHDQVVQVDANGGCTYRAFTHEDIFAEDWWLAGTPKPEESAS